MYSEKIMQLFAYPKNVGIIKNAEAVGEVGDANSTDFIKLYLSVEDGIINDAKFKAFGNPATIACVTTLTRILRDKNIFEIVNITGECIEEHIGGLPDDKKYIIPLINQLLASCIEDYNKKIEKLNKNK